MTEDDRIRAQYRKVKNSGRWDPGTENYMSRVWMTLARRWKRPVREIKNIVGYRGRTDW